MGDLHIPAAVVRAAWSNPHLTVAQAARSIGYASHHALQKRAKAMGLPPRRMGRWRMIGGVTFEAMWLANVVSAEIAGYFGVKDRSAAQAARLAGLPARKPGPFPQGITLDQFWQLQLARRMAADAAREQASMINAEMADKVNNRRVGAR